MILYRHLFHLFSTFVWCFHVSLVGRLFCRGPAELCAATAGPRGNLDWSRLGSFSPEIFCAATLLKRKSHNLTLLTKRKQHKTNTLHTPKNVTYKKRTVWKQEAGSFTWIFSCLWFRKSPNLQNQKHKKRKNIRSLDVFWISLGLFNGYDKYQKLSFPTVEKFWRDIFLWKENASPHHGPAKISIL